MAPSSLEHYRLIKSIGYGIATGIAYYIIFAYIIPYIFYSTINIPLEMSSPRIAVFLGFFIALGVAERIIKHPVVLALKALGKVVGIIIALIILNYGELHTSVYYDNYLLNVKLNIKPILSFLIIISLVYGVVDAFSTLEKLEENKEIRETLEH